MIYFLIGTLIGSALVGLAWPIVESLLRVLGSGHRGRSLEDSGSRRTWKAVSEWLGSQATRLVLIAVVLSLSLWLADRSFLETEINVRLILGALFGYLIVALVHGKRVASKAPTVMGLADREQETLYDGGERYSREPWWGRPSSLIPLALIALPLIALVAPHGELDLGFVRSLKTPFIEAQFARNEIEFRLDLKSEPQGFFKLGPEGLGDALHMARNEVIFRKHFPDGANENAGRVASHEKALGFINSVLQPVSLCAYEFDFLYGDQEILVATLRKMGAGLARALALSVKAMKVQAPAANPEQSQLAQEMEGLAKKTLVDNLKFIDEVKAEHLPVLRATSETPWPQPPCKENFAEKLEEYSPQDLSAIMRHPAVVHAASMFFLWSGNPSAVLRMLETAERGARTLVEEYPALYHVRGFAKRWEAERAADEYLREWEQGIKQLETRLRRMKQHLPVVKDKCTNTELAVFKFEPHQINQPFDSDQLQEECSAGDTANCNIRLAYGYYTHLLEKLRNQLMYESARELMTSRSLEKEEKIFDRALVYAEKSKEFVDSDGLKYGNCFTQQEVWPKNGKMLFAVTSARTDHEYAASLDSYGSLMVAKALRVESGDEDTLEIAIKMFDRSLGHAEKAEDSGRFVETIREHRVKARQALGLTAR